MALLGKLSVAASLLFSSYANSSNERSNTEVRALATLSGSGIQGQVEFTQTRYTTNTTLVYSIIGLQANAKHGLSIKEGSEPASPGDTYNPFAKKHGGPWNVERKVGDLGNVKSDEQGEAKNMISDPFLKLSGPFSIVGRVVALHENPDDLGYGRKEDSLVNGGVGGILVSGNISSL